MYKTAAFVSVKLSIAGIIFCVFLFIVLIPFGDLRYGAALWAAGCIWHCIYTGIYIKDISINGESIEVKNLFKCTSFEEKDFFIHDIEVTRHFSFRVYSNKNEFLINYTKGNYSMLKEILNTGNAKLSAADLEKRVKKSFFSPKTDGKYFF